MDGFAVVVALQAVASGAALHIHIPGVRPAAQRVYHVRQSVRGVRAGDARCARSRRGGAPAGADRHERMKCRRRARRQGDPREFARRFLACVAVLDPGLGRVCPRSLRLRVRIACNALAVRAPAVIVRLMALLFRLVSPQPLAQTKKVCHARRDCPGSATGSAALGRTSNSRARRCSRDRSGRATTRSGSAARWDRTCGVSGRRGSWGRLWLLKRSNVSIQGQSLLPVLLACHFCRDKRSSMT